MTSNQAGLNNDQMHKSQNLNNFAQPKMQMIQENVPKSKGNGLPAKPFSASHGSRKNERAANDQRYGAISKQSTQNNTGARNTQAGVYQLDSNKPPKARMASIPGMSKSTQKSFQPLREMGRLGHVMLSNERQQYTTQGNQSNNNESMGYLPGENNYKSHGTFDNKMQVTSALNKSKSAAKNLRPLVNSRKGSRR